MKILFVENRYKTAFWEVIAKHLIKDGHEICWIVQNHMFKPDIGEVIMIPYFKNNLQKNKEYTPDIRKTIQSNRGINYFGIKSDDFIFYYKEQIENAIEQLKPDIAFGECTMFHELLIINQCRSQGILYLHPSCCRYPPGRFSFYKFDTYECFGGSREKWSMDDALNIIGKIINRIIIPDYIKVIKPRLEKMDLIINKVMLSIGYYLGERFNTPSPLLKTRVEKRKKHLIKEWDSISVEKVINDGRFKILYPLQMQPEANIDIWGYPYNDQLEVIKSIVQKLRANDVLYLKPNPKSKYELSGCLLEYVKDNKEKIVLLAHRSLMNDVFPCIDFVITVTGTVSFECIWGDKPFIALGECLPKKYSYQKDLNNGSIYSKKYSPFPDTEKVNLMNDLLGTSYKGNIGDSLFGKELMANIGNMENILFAFKEVLKQVNK